MSRSKRVNKQVKWNIGKLCPNCNKGKIEGCDQKNKEGHRHHRFCPKCKRSNF